MLSITLALPLLALASDDDAGEEALVVVAEPARGSASARGLDAADVAALPGRAADELLRAMPGLHQSAHGGRGKALQYFLRGFDAVHGADLAVSVEGVPLNEPSNVHAHGYLDLNLLPRAAVRRVDLWPGTFRADLGDFGIAGAADYGVGVEREGAFLGAVVGTDLSAGLSAAWRPRGAPAGRFLAVEADAGRGVGEARGWRLGRVAAGHEVARGDVSVRAFALAADVGFASPGVLREDDLADGAVGFWGAYPGSGGGRSSRALAALQARGGGEGGAWTASVHLGWRALDLRQNFTGFYADPVHGDATRQRHGARTAGASARGARRLDAAVTVRGGFAAQLVDLDASVGPEPARDEAPAEAFSALQGDAGAWVGATWRPAAWLVLEPGLRAAVFLVDPAAASVAWAPAVAPRLALTAGEGPLVGFLAAGRGTRSPDARGVGDGGRAPVAVADGAELGARWSPSAAVSARLALFGSLVSDEIVFDHVAARYLATGATRRGGVDAGLTWAPSPAVRLDLDLTASEGRYAASGAPIPYAPRWLASAGLLARGVAVGPARLVGGVRGWFLGPRPLPGGFTSRPTGAVDLSATAEAGAWVVDLDLDNALGLRWRDGEFAYPSAWDPGAPRSELPARHVTAGAPTALRLGLGRRW